jgi:hypothetical protein
MAHSSNNRASNCCKLQLATPTMIVNAVTETSARKAWLLLHLGPKHKPIILFVLLLLLLLLLLLTQSHIPVDVFAALHSVVRNILLTLVRNRSTCRQD